MHLSDVSIGPNVILALVVSSAYKNMHKSLNAVMDEMSTSQVYQEK